MGILDLITRRESPNLVALDISPARIKLLALSGQSDSYRIDAFATEALPANAFADHQIAEPEVIGQTIAHVMQRAGCRLKQAAVAVSGSAVISKVIDMPAMLSEDEIEEQIGYEADAYIPYPIEEVSLDFQVLGRSERDDDMQSVLLAACRRDTVDLYIGAVEMAGLETKVVDVEAYALQNACGLLIDQLPEHGAGQTLAVVDLGGSSTAVNVLRDGETVYTREQAFGGAQLVEELQHDEDLGSADEALARLRAGEFGEDFRAHALPRFAEQAAQQIDRSLQLFFSSSSQHDHVDQILLAGGCALLPDIDTRIASELGIPVSMANPLAGMQAAHAARRNRVEAESPSLMVATGLALRAFN